MTLNELIERKKTLEKIISYSERALKGAPEGALRCVRRGDKWLYFLRQKGHHDNGKYLNNSQTKLIKKLGQKRYNILLLKKAKAELINIDELIALYKNGKPEDTLDNISEAYRSIVTPIVEPDYVYAERWLSAEYPKNTYLDETKKFKTAKNEMVRSKSEMIIADMLTRNNIPYIYEKSLTLGGIGTVYPDFTLLDLNNRREIYWEHLGLMNDSDYSDKATRKIQYYAKNTIFPGDRLILTFESANNPLDINSIENMILSIMPKCQLTSTM